MSTFTSEKLEDICRKQGDLAATIGAIPCLTKHKDGTKHCVQAEEKRPLSTAEKKKGWARRPFDAYEDANMCEPCSAYWHASVAQVRIHGLARRESMIEAETNGH